MNKEKMMRIACYITCAATFGQIEDVLEKEGFECERFTSDKDLMVALRRGSFGLVLIDVEPWNKSLTYAWLGCRADMTPVVLLSLKVDAEEVAQALDSGAEDFIRRPVAPVELRSRITTVLRRYGKDTRRRPIEWMGFSLDRITGEIFDRGIRVHLTPREFQVAWLFFSWPGTYLKREKISASIWGVETAIAHHTIEQHVSVLRKKLKLYPERGVQLRAVYNNGYRLEVAGQGERDGRCRKDSDIVSEEVAAI